MQSRRILAAVAVLAIVWIGVYWATPPAPQPAAAITFDNPRGAPESEHEVPPFIAPPPVVQSPPPAVKPPPTAAVVRESAPRQPSVIPPSFRDRVVRPGETMEAIARAELGDAALWTVVASANPRIDPLKLRPGMTVRIPIDPTNIQGKPNPDLHPAADPAPTDAPQTIEYVVRPGDTLGGIARTYYNSASRWRIILDANRDVLDRPEALRPGMKLVIPPAPPAD